MQQKANKIIPKITAAALLLSAAARPRCAVVRRRHRAHGRAPLSSAPPPHSLAPLPFGQIWEEGAGSRRHPSTPLAVVAGSRAASTPAATPQPPSPPWPGAAPPRPSSPLPPSTATAGIAAAASGQGEE
uniref:Uncharacterized protein n=1 Tax=Oryza rufipogon TaxID=4529 RepID=A0A0E0MR99_ORYRU